MKESAKCIIIGTSAAFGLVADECPFVISKIIISAHLILVGDVATECTHTHRGRLLYVREREVEGAGQGQGMKVKGEGE